MRGHLTTHAGKTSRKILNVRCFMFLLQASGEAAEPLFRCGTVKYTSHVRVLIEILGFVYLWLGREITLVNGSEDQTVRRHTALHSISKIQRLVVSWDSRVTIIGIRSERSVLTNFLFPVVYWVEWVSFGKVCRLFFEESGRFLAIREIRSEWIHFFSKWISLTHQQFFSNNDCLLTMLGSRLARIWREKRNRTIGVQRSGTRLAELDANAKRAL